MNQWVSIAGCGAVSIVGGPLAMEAVNVIGPNQAAPLVGVQGLAPDGAFFILVINGVVFMPVAPVAPVGAQPPFIVSGFNITWQSPDYGFNVSDTVVAAYSYGGTP